MGSVFVFVSRLEICRQSIATVVSAKMAKMAKKCPKMGYPLKNTIFNLCQGYTPKKVRRLAKVPFLPNQEHQKRVNAALFSMVRR